MLPVYSKSYCLTKVKLLYSSSLVKFNPSPSITPRAYTVDVADTLELTSNDSKKILGLSYY